jgi:hypothetical protein
MPTNGGSGAVDDNLLTGEIDLSKNRFQLLNKINMQCSEYEVVRSKVQMGVEK